MFQFKKHYTIEEARALLPQVRKWLELLNHCRQRIEQLEKRFEGLLAEGYDAGGDSVNQYIRTLSELRAVLVEFHTREIQVKDVERGLIDFPSLRQGREVFLCWESDDDDIEHWHELDSGFAGREPI
ncbi:MAG: DUF2203 domain-containing protein [Verrucomicrobia bacterium]|nr:DUF2203 domain-containing protein [Verrucomicrobiota bacterium]